MVQWPGQDDRGVVVGISETDERDPNCEPRRGVPGIEFHRFGFVWSKWNGTKKLPIGRLCGATSVAIPN